ncbi:MAG TPA: hypothetical protein VNY84_01820, partial [Acidimicrobiales bacterium]|nr:hypothetical protein [Acidimicrobiales bacterium]
MHLRRRISALSVAVAVVGGLFVAMVATAPSAVANTSQNNGCLGVTGTFSTFAVPITGTATPTVVVPAPITLSGVSVAIQVAASLIAAGVNTGLVSAADSVPDLGVSAQGTDVNAGINAVIAGPGKVTLNITATNATPALQTVTNSAPANTTFWVTTTSIAAPATGVTTVYDAITAGSTPTVGNAADASRTAHVLTGNLTVTIPLDATTATPPAVGAIAPGNTVWTPTSAGTVTFAEQNTAPATLVTTVGPPATGPSSIDQNAAPLIILPKINGAVSAPFHCWPGTTTADAPAVGDTALVPAGSTAIATSAATSPPAPPVVAPGTYGSAGSPFSNVGGGQTVVIDVLAASGLTDVTPPIDPSTLTLCTGTVSDPASCSGKAGPFGPSHGTVTTQSGSACGPPKCSAAGGLEFVYHNDGAGVASSDSFQFAVCGTNGLCLDPTVFIGVLNNSCTTGSDTAALTPNADGPEPEVGTDVNGCQLKQVLIVPIAPSTLKMDQAASQDILGCQLVSITNPLLGCANGNPPTGPPVLNGNPMYVAGLLSEVTVTNARGTDDGWTLTGQVTDFVDGTRAGLASLCSAPNPTPSIGQSPPNNHCIPGSNLGWQPSAAIVDQAVPGDTAAVTPGGTIVPPIPGLNITGTVARPVLPITLPIPNLHDAAQVLCYAQDNQSGGTFHCDAGLALAVPGSA